MQIVGYMRAVPGVEGGRLYAQGEAIREWARRSNASIIGLFQDDDGQVAGAGFRAMLRTLDEQVDAVIVADRTILSADAVGQEIIRDHLRGLGIGIAAADGIMETEDDLPIRQVVRDVLSRRQELDAVLTTPQRVPEPVSDGLILEIVPDVPDAAIG